MTVTTKKISEKSLSIFVDDVRVGGAQWEYRKAPTGLGHSRGWMEWSGLVVIGGVNVEVSATSQKALKAKVERALMKAA